jgi:beta-galactosidase
MTDLEPRRTGMLTSGIAYGGDYNPEQWDESYLEEDVRLMHEAGVTVATVGVFSWSLLEPEPGRYELDWIARVLDRLHEAGIGVDLATGTASPPAWLGELHPDTLPVTREGTRLWWGSRQQYNPSSAVLREKITALVSRLADRFAHHPALVAWHVGNEYGCHVHESYDEESAQRFREWLRKRHGSLKTVNDVWGTAFWSQHLSDWSQIIPPRATPTFANPHHATDWRAFCSDALLDLYLLERDILRAANPAVPVTTNFMGLFAPLDYWRWAEHLDFICNDSYPDPADPRAAREFALDCDLMRSLGGGRPFVQMEQVTSAVQWRPRNATKRPGQYALWSTQAVARGADGILNFQWRQSLAGSETFHGAMVPHAGARSHTWTEVVDLGRTLAALGEVQGSRVAADVALVWDWENSWAQQASIGPVADPVPEQQLRAWHASFFERGVAVDIVHPSADLSGYRVVVVPALFRLTTEHAARLRQAVRAGTSVVVTYLTGYVDESGHAVQGGYLGPITDLLGVRVVDIAPVAVVADSRGPVEPLHAGIDRISAQVGTPATARTVPLKPSEDSSFPGQGQTWAERLELLDPQTQAVAHFADGDLIGQPAVTVRRQPDGGAAWYVGTDLDARGRDGVLTQVLSDAGVPSGVTAPVGVDIARRGPVTFVLNHSDTPATVTGIDGHRVDDGSLVTGHEVTVPARSAVLVRHPASPA